MVFTRRPGFEREMPTETGWPSHEDRNHNDLPLAFLHCFGVDAKTFGDPRYDSGPLTQLLV